MSKVKFYRYLIYSIYSWRLEEKDDTPVATTIIMLCAIHSIQIILLLAVIGRFYPKVIFIFKQQKIYFLFFFFLFCFIYYLLVYNKHNWNQYIEEYKYETQDQKKKGGILVWLFTWGSIVLFFIIVPALFWPRN
jgi:hypothetical protein